MKVRHYCRDARRDATHPDTGAGHQRYLSWGQGLVAFCLGLVVTDVLAAGSGTTAEINTLNQFYDLSHEQAGEGRPCRFTGVVLCNDTGWSQFYIHDGIEAHWFNPQRFSQTEGISRAKPGQQVEITAVTATVEGRKELTNFGLTVLKSGVLPPAKPRACSQLGGDLGQWIEVSGRVRMVDFSWERALLSLNEQGQSCRVFILGSPRTNDIQRLLGSLIRVRGINDSKAVAGRLEMASVMVPGLDQVSVLEPGRSPTPLRAGSIDGLLNRELGDWTNRPVCINGFVASYEPGNMLLVRDPTGVIRAEIQQVTQVSFDARVEVFGYLKVTTNETLLTDAWFEVVKAASAEVAKSSSSNSLAGSLRKSRTLTRTSEILKLRNEEAAEGLPVKLRGVVLYADPEWRNGFLHDQRGGVYFDLSQSDVRAGQFVELTGETGLGGFAPDIHNASVRVLGTTNLPTPAKVDLADLADGHLDAQWVELEGVVRHVRLEWGHLNLSVMTSKGRFTAILAGFENQPSPTNLIDAFVSIQGACASELNVRKQVSGISLHVPGMDQIKILEPAPADPFSIAAIPIATVSKFDPDRLAGRRIKVSGVVTLKIPNQGLIIQDPSGGIRVRTQQPNQLQAGDAVEVLGFPALGEFSPELEGASIRQAGSDSPPVAQVATAEDILLRGAHDGRLVTLEARLQQNVPRAANPQLVLQDGTIFFTARIEAAVHSRGLAALQSGSVVRLTGVCSIQGGEGHEPKGFRLLLRSPADVELISSPPWWTARRIIWVLAGLGGVLLLALVWVRALRRQVRWQTRKLREQIAERDGMQVQIEKTHKDLLIASRQAGMAEVATSVLHNVGNVLNSVNTSVSVVADRLNASKLDGITRVADLLEQNRHDLPAFFAASGRADQVINFLRSLAQHLTADQKLAIGEMSELSKNVEHIKEIVAMQQSYARVAGVTESVSVVELVEDALRMNRGALLRHDVQLVRDWPPGLPVITVDKHKVLQILVNLIRNAKYACDESGREDKQLTVQVRNGEGRVQVIIGDNGVGIAAENLTRIFSHGFTTRKEGHGFGLHSGALAARELGGSLTVHSDGPGCGATFTLELPIQLVPPLATKAAVPRSGSRTKESPQSVVLAP